MEKQETGAPVAASSPETSSKTHEAAPSAFESARPQNYRSGIVALVGRPNVGKSTLLNRFIGEKLAITSPKPQTTRNRILGVLTRPDCQVAFLDTPGIHKPKGALHRFMVDTALSSIDEVDAVLFVIEASLRRDHSVEIGDTVREIVQRVKRAHKPVVLAINKIDTLPKPLLLPIIDTYRRELPEAEIFPICARDGEGLEELLEGLKSVLPEGEPLFPDDMLTDQAERFIVAEFIREQVLRSCRDEVPYSTAVDIDHFDESDREPLGPVKPGELGGLIRIAATIYVERESQKAIVIGKGARMLKQIGADARRAIERFLGTHVYLSILVKVEPRWSERTDALRRFGYREGK